MNKKVMMIGAGLTLGSALLVTSAFADIGGARGYEAYKSALKRTAAIDSATHAVTLSLQDNGRELLNVKSTVKEDEATGNASGQVAITGNAVTETIDFYGQDGKVVVKAGSGDVYYVFADSDREEWERHDEALDPAVSRELENVVDALVGNLKDDVNVTEQSDGRKTIDMTLTGSQIPAPVNVIGSLIVKEALNGEHRQEKRDASAFDHRDLGIDFERIAAHFPELTSNVNIDEVALRAEIDANNVIDAHAFDITISGQDAAGEKHQVVIRTDIELTDAGATKADTIDLTGKNVQTIEE